MSDPSTPPDPATPQAKDPFTLRIRREPFEYGLLPTPKLIFPDPTATLTTLKLNILPVSLRVNSSALSNSLQIPLDHAELVLNTLASVLPDTAKISDGDDGANVFDLLIFLYIQSYKRLLPRGHKDSAAVADVWPHTSAFDGFLSALSPLQLVRSNSRKFMPSQSDEEAHRLSYLQKHLANILLLLGEPDEGEGDESLVLSMERFENLGLLIQFVEKGSEPVPLSQAAPFFSNSDPDMPAAPVSATQVHDWLSQKIADSLERISEKATTKENGPSDQDVAMSDANTSSTKTSTSSIYIEGISKSSYIKHAAEVKGSSLKLLNCHDSVIYVLAPLKYATIYGCSDATIVIGAVGKALRVEHCERVHVIATTKRVCIANCRECMFYMGVNQRPVIVGDNYKLQVAPYNTFYPQLEEHMDQVGIEPTVNRWNEPLTLGAVDPHDLISHPTGVSDAHADSAALLDPDLFTKFLIPNWFADDAPGATKDNPFTLSEAYLSSQHKNHTNLGEVKQILQETPLDEGKKRELSCALHVLFKDWLYASGNVRQLYSLQGD